MDLDAKYELLMAAVEAYIYNPTEENVAKSEKLAEELEAVVKVRKQELFQAIENEMQPDKLVVLMAEQEAFITKFWEFI